MSKKTLITGIVVILAILGLAYWGIHRASQNAQNSGQAAASTTQATVTGFTVEKPNFVVKGSNLGRVMIYAVPTGTNIGEADIKTVGRATLQDTSAGTQTWILPIPKDQFLATDIYVIGYNNIDQPADSRSLGLTGATAINNVLWGNGTIASSTAGQQNNSNADEYKQLKIGQSATYNGLKLTLKSIEDSRCPAGVNCIQAGTLKATVVITLNGKAVTQQIDSSTPFVYQGYTISLSETNTLPKAGTKDYSQYVLTFRIQEG